MHEMISSFMNPFNYEKHLMNICFSKFLLVLQMGEKVGSVCYQVQGSHYQQRINGDSFVPSIFTVRKWLFYKMAVILP